MRISYYPETDTLYIETNDSPSIKTRDITEDGRLDLDDDNDIVGIELENASRYCDLSYVKVSGIDTLTFGGEE